MNEKMTTATVWIVCFLTVFGCSANKNRDDVLKQSTAPKDLTYCLDSRGIMAVLYPRSATSALYGEMLIPYAEVSTYFDLPEKLLKAGRK